MLFTIEATAATIVAMSDGSLSIRDASERDAEACAVIYAPYVTDTAITFEIDPPSPAEMATRIATAVHTHAWVVLENEGRVVGYAYGGPFKSRAAYRWSCEVSVYLERSRRRAGSDCCRGNELDTSAERLPYWGRGNGQSGESATPLRIPWWRSRLGVRAGRVRPVS